VVSVAPLFRLFVAIGAVIVSRSMAATRFDSAGFIATHVVRILLIAGYRVRGTVRDPSDGVKTQPLRDLPNGTSHLELVAADLLSDDGWEEAVKGTDFVIHMASPFVIEAPKDKDELIRPAVDGTTRVIKAALAEPSVKRVVLTSSVVSISAGRPHDRSTTPVSCARHSMHCPRLSPTSPCRLTARQTGRTSSAPPSTPTQSPRRERRWPRGS
jgi:nucleoside-diphosphate-sugar epimerase